MNQGESSLAGAVLGGRYRVGTILGKGGMGAVYEAVQQDLGRKVAVKVLHPHLAFHPDALQRFRQEAQSAAALGHPNIVQITDFQANPAEPAFLVMEYLEGQSLAQAIAKEGPLPAPRLAFIVAQMLSGLAAAHRANIVHRDIKPDNVFLTSTSAVRDLVKLLDFGIAKLQGDTADAHLTATGAMIGTPAYMSPEQARGLPIDARTDLYAVGACMYHALSGRFPFHATSLPALLVAIFEQPAAPLASVCPGIDPRMEAIVARAMAKDPAARFSSAEEMRAALAPFSDPTSAHEATRPPAQMGAPAQFGAPSPGAYTTPPVHASMTPMASMAPMPPMSPMQTGSPAITQAGAAPRLEQGRSGGRAMAIVAAVVVLAAAGGGIAYFALRGPGDTPTPTAVAALPAAGPTAPIATVVAVSPVASAPPAQGVAHTGRPGSGPGSPSPSPSTSTSNSNSTSTSTSTPTPTPTSTSTSTSTSPPTKLARFAVVDSGVYAHTNTDVRAAMEATMGAASTCFARFPPPDSTPNFFVTVTAAGAITAVGNANGASAPRNPSLDQCMRGVAQAMRLGKPTGAGFFSVGYKDAR